jgi:transposase-like protein
VASEEVVAKSLVANYELFQRSAPMQASVWDKMMRGLSTRNYRAVVEDFHDAYGIEKSAVSENFIEASGEKVKQLIERPLGELRLCAVLIDGTPFKDRQMIVAVGIGCDGRKKVLGIREGATENAAVRQASFRAVHDDRFRSPTSLSRKAFPIGICGSTIQNVKNLFRLARRMRGLPFQTMSAITGT